MTENHNYRTPEKGAMDWNVPLNNNFRKIDTDIEIRDVEANKNNYSPKQDAKYVATDSGAVYLGDGTSWVLADLKIGMLEAERLSVGDGEEITNSDNFGSSALSTVKVVDDSTTIQAAHDALPAYSDGGRIRVTPDYDGEDALPIIIDRPVILEGDGWGDNTEVDFSSNPEETVFQIDVADFPRRPVVFKDLSVQGGNIGLELRAAQNFHAIRCLFNDQETSAVTWSGSTFGGWCRFVHCWFSNAGGIGVDMTGPLIEPNETDFYGCGFKDNGAAGIKVWGFSTNIIGGGIERNAGPGIRFGDSSSVSALVDGTYFEQNGEGETGVYSADVCIDDGSLKQQTVLNTFHTDAATPADWAVYIAEGDNNYINNIRGPEVDVGVGRYTKDVYLGWVDPRGSIYVDEEATRPRINNLGVASGNAEKPDTSNWRTGEMVDWTDTGDGSGDGVYILQHDGRWTRM